MRRYRLLPLLVALCSCNDYLTGQPGEPDGPLMITRLTLLDQTSRDAAVFTDTSAPADCTDPAVKDTDACQGDIFKDLYGVKKSPPNPDSGQMMRAVFNKLPLLINGMQVEIVVKQPMQPPTSMMFADPTAIDLVCPGQCTAIPPLLKTLQITGSPLSPTPTDPRFAYGPALQMQVMPDDMHPLAALEPATMYQVTVNPGVSDRNNNKVLLDDTAQKLLVFTTEPFQTLQVGIGDSADDPYVYNNTANGDGSAAHPYQVMGLSQNGVVSIKMNASVYEPAFQATSATSSVPVKIGLSQLVKDMQGKTVCDAGNHRTIYLFPGTMDGTWGTAQQLTITLHGADVHDISQAAGHPQGRHTLPGDVVLSVMLTGKPADPMTYKGLTSDMVSALADCPK